MMMQKTMQKVKENSPKAADCGQISYGKNRIQLQLFQITTIVYEYKYKYEKVFESNVMITNGWI